MWFSRVLVCLVVLCFIAGPGAARVVPVFVYGKHKAADWSQEERDAHKEILVDALEAAAASRSADGLSFEVELIGKGERGVDVLMRSPSEEWLALIPTGTYYLYRRLGGDDQADDLRRLGIVERSGTVELSFTVLAPAGESLFPPTRWEGRLCARDPGSLSGSILPLRYLFKRHGFPKDLIGKQTGSPEENRLRSRWVNEDKKLNLKRPQETLCPSPSTSLLLGKSTPGLRREYGEDGQPWDVYPKPDEEEWNLVILRSLLVRHGRELNELDEIVSEALFPESGTPAAVIGFLEKLGWDAFHRYESAKYDKLFDDAYEDFYVPALDSRWYDRPDVAPRLRRHWMAFPIAVLVLLGAHLSRQRLARLPLRSPLGWLALVGKLAAWSALVWLLPERQIAAAALGAGALLGFAAPVPRRRYQPVEEPLVGSFDLFVSYSSRDRNVVRQVLSDLREREITFWWDEEQLSVGADIVTSIGQGLKASRFVLACFSRHQERSGWARREYSTQVAKSLSGTSGIEVLPLVLDDLPQNRLPELLQGLKFVRYGDRVSYLRFVDDLALRVRARPANENSGAT